MSVREDGSGGRLNASSWLRREPHEGLSHLFRNTAYESSEERRPKREDADVVALLD